MPQNTWQKQWFNARVLLSGSVYKIDKDMLDEIESLMDQAWADGRDCGAMIATEAGKNLDVVFMGKTSPNDMDTCPICKKSKPDVYERPNAYANDVGNDPTATHVACDECDHENAMDI